MSTSVTPRPTAGATPARQQLDELEALLQRMLDLPVQPTEEPAAPSPPEPPPRAVGRPSDTLAPRVVRSAPESAPRPAPAPEPVADAQPSSAAEDWVKLASTWQPSAQTWGPLAESWKQTTRADPVPGAPEPASVEKAPTPSANVATAPTAPSPAPSPAPAMRDDPGPPIAWYLWPFLAFNAVFDTALFLVWPLRGWLRSRGGRGFLGFIGILCLLTAAGWAGLDWYGWFGWTR